MPAHYAHTCFGQKVFSLLHENTKENLKVEKALFIIGLQGPDILFYHKPLSKSPFPALGHSIHKESGAATLSRFAKVIQDESKDDADALALKSYTAGFLCHYLLDSACHPLVDSAVENNGLNHSEIEAEFDKYLMKKKGVNPFHRNPLAHLLSDKRTCLIISKFYENSNPETIKNCLDSMENITKLASGLLSDLRPLTTALLKIAGKYNSYQGIILKKKGDYRHMEFSPELEEILENQVEEAALLVDGIFKNSNVDPEKMAKRLETDFSGKLFLK